MKKIASLAQHMAQDKKALQQVIKTPNNILEYKIYCGCF